MKYLQKDYVSFLNRELETQIKEYEQLICSKALVLKDNGTVFVGRFIKLQPTGIAIFKVRDSDNMPRKNSFWTASFLVGEMGSFKNWGNYSWAELRQKHQRTYSDALCIWIQKSDEKGFCLVGIKNLTTEIAKLLELEKPIIAFGPKEPPIQYISNLMDIVRNHSCKETQLILDYEETSNQWSPQKIGSKEDFNSILLNDMKNNDCIVVQGPPGTGKTYRIAQFTAYLLGENKSVLVTALTNQALMELAKKEDILPYLEKGKVSKTSLKL